MTSPDILLSEFQKEPISDVISGNLAQTHEDCQPVLQLEDLALIISSRQRHGHSVHFYLKDNACKGKVSATLRNNGAYFGEA
ncbi:hypothetical protein P154DRAFT_577586 [Amniculicola lignicola CBS 123094]|uniref:Uncharacterized protein n=1 Tax=Amniculicola lignicola CBS 123094 TaxID=1392246 RepID=A0A6A5WF00_9PLEO|nr:hypothetical protein P154DRAFT_577586 [Amniculicola lignicola CBS 123094]